MEFNTIDLDGPVHYVEYDGPADGPTFVLIHALAAHHGTWVALAPMLAERGRVLVVDMPGFGLSPLAQRRATLTDHRAILDRFIDAVVDGPAILVGNSMGGATAFLQAVAAPAKVAGLVMVAPAMAATRIYTVDPKIVGIFAATLAPTRALRAVSGLLPDLTAERFVEEMIKVCTVNPARVPAAVVEASLEVMRARLQHLNEGVVAFSQATRSVTRFVLRPRRYIAQVRDLGVPSLVMLGERDQLVPEGLARAVVRARPDWGYEILPDVGHMPQIEDPAMVAERITDWLGTTPGSAATAIAG